MPKLSIADHRARVSQNEARRRKEVALAEIREAEAGEKAGRLLAADQVNAAWADTRTKIKGAVLRLPVKCATKMAAVSDPREVRAVLQAECESILRELVNAQTCGDPSYAWSMKTAVSIPDDVFQGAERLARRTRKSRSQLFSDAIREYVARHAADEITDAMDRVCADIETAKDEFVSRAASRVLEKVEW